MTQSKQEAGIYLEFVPIGLTKWAPSSLNEAAETYHAYLVYRDGKGGEFVIRGGPPDKAHPNYNGGYNEPIIYENHVPLHQSKDRYENGETPQTRLAYKLDLGGRDVEKVWGLMRDDIGEFGTTHIPYNLFNTTPDGEMQNSNSVIFTLLRRHSIEVPENYKNLVRGDNRDITEPYLDSMYDRAEKAVIETKENIGEFAREVYDKGTQAADKIGTAIEGGVRRSVDWLQDGWRNIFRGPRADEHSALPVTPYQAARGEARLAQSQIQADPESGTPYSAARGLIASTDPAAVAAALGQTLQKSYPTAALPDEVWIEDLLAKPPATWTEAERDRVMTHQAYWRPRGAWGQRYAQPLGQAVMGWYEHIYGTGPVRYDATGRMAQARPQHQP